MKTFSHLRRVTYADCTVGNHVYYANFLPMLEEARGEYFRSLGHSFLEWQTQDTIFPVVECRVKYKAPAKYDDVLSVEVWVTMAKGARLNFEYRIETQEKVLVLEAETFHVCTGVEGKPKRLPDALTALDAPEAAEPTKSTL